MTAVERIRELCKKKGISITILEQELGFSNGSITKPKVIPSDRLLLIAQYFNVSMEYLLGTEVPGVDFQISTEEMELLVEFRKTDDASRDMVRRLLSYSKLLKNENKE